MTLKGYLSWFKLKGWGIRASCARANHAWGKTWSRALINEYLFQENLRNRKLKAGEASAKEKNDDLLSKIFKLIFGKPKADPGEESEIGERTKTLQNLEFVIEKVANVFQVGNSIPQMFNTEISSRTQC